jgi:hypothetical protein
MKHQDDLFELVKSLSRNEKRYFRMYAMMQKGSKSYLKLFDELVKQKVYNEESIKQKFLSGGFEGQFAFTKNYLYNHVIRSLVSFNQKTSPDMKIHTMISECKILFDKALYRKYFRKIEETRKLALKYERYGYLTQILDLEKVIIRKEELQSEKTKNIYQDADKSLENIKQIFNNSKIASQLMIAYRSHGLSRGKEHDKLLDGILNSMEPVLPGSTNSFRAKEAYYRIMELKALTKAEYGKMLEALEKRLEMVNKAPEAFEDLIIDYRNDILYSLIDTCLLLNRPENAELYLKELYYQSSGRITVNNDNTIITTFARFRIMLKRNEIDKAEALIPELENILITYRDKILLDIELGIMFRIINCRILAGNFTEALKMHNRLSAHPLIEKRKDFESYLKILSLIIHFEMKNYTLLKHLIISTYRYLYKQDKLFKLEQLIIEFIRKLPGVKNEHDLGFMFGKYTKKIRTLSRDKYERNAFEYFDYLKWIETKTAMKV